MSGSGSKFENKVREIARILWNVNEGEGAAQIIDGRERDCIFNSGDLINYIECTISNKKEKITYDAKKMVDYRKKMSEKNIPVKLWIITQSEPTADQRSAAKEYKIEILSLNEFEKKIINASEYFRQRMNHKFGSATDPYNDTVDVSKVKYFTMKMRSNKHESPKINIDELVELLLNNNYIVLLGEYGMGKSLTLREVFINLKKKYEISKIDKMPILINLRDHWGQNDIYEILDRHARHIGLKDVSSLTKAFNIGKLLIMLDGFDEFISSNHFSRSEFQIKQARKENSSVIRKFAEHQKNRNGLIVSGREHFFDSEEELQKALNVKSEDIFRLEGFDKEEIKIFFKNHNLNIEIPDWIPNKPLLLSYLFLDESIKDIILYADEESPQKWNHIIDKICQREANIHQSLDSEIIRDILEDLACVARETTDGKGPIKIENIINSYKKITKSDSSEVSQIILYRLPFLSQRNMENFREFIDDSILDILKASSINKFIKNNYSKKINAKNWKSGLKGIGYEFIKNDNFEINKILNSLENAQKLSFPTLALDILQVAKLFNTEKIDCNHIQINQGTTNYLDLTTLPELSNIYFKDVIIDNIIYSGDNLINVKFVDCLFQKATGFTEKQNFNIFENCEIENYDTIPTNASTMKNEQININIRICLVILKKIYLQHGYGRKENALYRGIENTFIDKINHVLKILKKHEFLYSEKIREETLWRPFNNKRDLIYKWINNQSLNPSLTEDIKNIQ
jgi:hypothetical protein